MKAFMRDSAFNESFYGEQGMCCAVLSSVVLCCVVLSIVVLC